MIEILKVLMKVEIYAHLFYRITHFILLIILNYYCSSKHIIFAFSKAEREHALQTGG